MLEKDIEKKLVSAVRELGGLCLKFESPGYTGVPDRVILLPGGIVAFAETKQPGKKERARQVLVQGLFRRLGFTVYSSVDSAEKIEAVVRDCRRLMTYGSKSI